MKEAVPERTCLFCRRSSPKKELLRFVWDGLKIVWDRHQDRPGRGGYCHRRVECLTRLTEMALWNRALKVVGVELKPQHLKDSLEFLHKEIPEIRGNGHESDGGKGFKKEKKGRVRL